MLAVPNSQGAPFPGEVALMALKRADISAKTLLRSREREIDRAALSAMRVISGAGTCADPHPGSAGRCDLRECSLLNPHFADNRITRRRPAIVVEIPKVRTIT